ncbi:MAG TPA: PAS domain S-box protein, partial [Pyrinomonadaceae bacterium]
MLDQTNLKSPELAPYWLAALIESADDAIISKTLQGIITSWNQGAERIFGYTADEVIGQPITIIIPPDHLDEEPKILARLRAGER